MNDACHHCITNKLLTIYLQPLQKNTITKETQEMISVATEHSGKHCTHSSFSQSVLSKTDQCDQCDSVIEENNKKKLLFTIGFLIILIGSLEKKNVSLFVNFPTGVKEKKSQNLQSNLHVDAKIRWKTGRRH